MNKSTFSTWNSRALCYLLLVLLLFVLVTNRVFAHSPVFGPPSDGYLAGPLQGTDGEGSQGFSENRTSFVRTDDTPQAVVYDRVHRLIFSSAPNLNCVDVISLETERVKKCIPVSGAAGLSLSADGAKVLVATQLGVVVWIDIASLHEVRRDIIPQLRDAPFPGTAYVSADQAYQAANGKIFLISGRSFGNGNFNPVTAIEWDPTAATSTLRPDSGGGGVISTTSDHSKLLFAGGGQVTVYDAATDKFTPLPGIGFQDGVINPMGSQFAVIGGTPFVRFFNLQMQQVGSTDVSTCCGPQITPPIAVYSPDGEYLYLTYLSQSGYPVLLTINTSSFQIVGSALAYSSNVVGSFAIPQAADFTGLVFEIADHGVAINDSTDFHYFTNTTTFPFLFGVSPDEGPLHEPTTIYFDYFDSAFSGPPEVFFGRRKAQNPQLINGQLAATAPPSSIAGPVNVKTVEPDGTMAFIPQGFTYGSLPIQYGDLAWGPEGGVLADLYGYGFSADIPGASIEVSVGLSQAPLQSQTQFTYPFPLQHLVVTAPAGTPGVQDIKVSSPNGTATFPRAFHYLHSVEDYPSGDSFQFVLYDSHRNQVYLSAVDHIDVFSLANYAFSAPIAVPSKTGAKLILGLALTPDGTKLLAANKNDQSVAIINPDDPTLDALTVSLPLAGMPGDPGPFEIAATSTNQAFVTVTVGNVLSGGTSDIYAIDLGSLQVTAANVPPGTLNLNNNYIQGSSDGTMVATATSNSSSTPILSWQAASKVWQLRYFLGYLGTNVTVSGDGTVLALGTYTGNPSILDARLNQTAQVSFPDIEVLQEGPSLQFDQSGALLYAVNGKGVDILDSRTGQLRERVLLSEPILGGPTEVLQSVVKSMDIGPAGDRIFLLTTAGLTVVELDSVPLAIGSVSPGSGPAGTVVTLRGSGFTRETAVRVRGVEARVFLVDGSTMRVTIPDSVRSGAAEVTLKNGEHSEYSVDDVFLVQ